MLIALKIMQIAMRNMQCRKYYPYVKEDKPYKNIFIFDFQVKRMLSYRTNKYGMAAKKEHLREQRNKLPCEYCALFYLLFIWIFMFIASAKTILICIVIRHL